MESKKRKSVHTSKGLHHTLHAYRNLNQSSYDEVKNGLNPLSDIPLPHQSNSNHIEFIESEDIPMLIEVQ